MNLTSSITEVKGLGKARAELFAKIGVSTIGDLIDYLPRDYEDRSILTPISRCEPGENYTFMAKIATTPQNSGFGKKIITTAMIKDDSGEIEVVWFNQPYLKNSVKKGDIYFFSGKIEQRGKKRQIHSPDYEKRIEDSPNTGRIIPIYRTVSGLSNKMIRRFMKAALDECKGLVEEFIPSAVLESFALMDREKAIYNIHFPENDESFYNARKRLVFEELLVIQGALLRLRGNIKKEPTEFTAEYTDTSGLGLPFELTKGQKNAVSDILGDLISGAPMYRLIQGDVGSGKTAVCAVACYIAIKNKWQAALMAPTEVLASQHYLSFKNMFDNLGIKSVLLTGSLKKSEKDYAKAMIESGEANMIIGTHALIQENVKYKNLGLVITDEQHRFGVNQKISFSEKGRNPHVLVMSATPIPRSLALTLYGDMDISIINELPPGRKEISTFAVDSAYRQRMFCFVEKEINAGRQAYVICASIEGGENTDILNVQDYGEDIKKKYLKSAKTATLHGKMKPNEKQEIMDMFSAGSIDILVSTTVIEVGVNNPNATVMIVENAERFGLSQLHQLRGRVGRGSEKSYCILVSDTTGEIGKKRLKVMSGSTDGFHIAELDLELRGPGDFFGTRQHGLPEFKIANLFKDTEIMKEARTAAEGIISGDLADEEEQSRFLAQAEIYLEAEKVYN